MAHPACRISDTIGREAGLRDACYALRGNQPLRWRSGAVFTVDPSLRLREGALSPVRVPHEPLRPGPAGRLFAVDPVDGVTNITRCRPDLDSPLGFTYDQGDPETHCRNAYFAAMQTYETFRRALGRPVAWAFWEEGRAPPLRLSPFGFRDVNAFYDRDEGRIAFGFGGDARDTRADANLLRFTALSSDVVAHEVTHALLDGLRPGYEYPVNPDVFAFHEAFADIVALLSRFGRPAYFGHLVRAIGPDFLRGQTLTSLAPEIGALVRKSGLRTLDVDWTTAERAGPGVPLYRAAPLEPHDRGGLLSSAIFEAFMRALAHRIEPLARLAQGAGASLLLAEIERIATSTASHFLAICIRAIDYLPPAAVLFPDYLRALITADRLLAPDDPNGYREEIIDAFRRRGIYPEGIEVISESALAWGPPQAPLRPVPGLALSELRFDINPALPLSAREIRRQAEALALAIDADPWFFEELGLRDRAADGTVLEPPVITSLRPTVRVGPDGFLDVSVIAEITQEMWRPVAGGRMRHRAGALLVLDAAGKPSLVVSQRMDNAERLAAEEDFAKEAIRLGLLVLSGESYAVDPAARRKLC